MQYSQINSGITIRKAKYTDINDIYKCSKSNLPVYYNIPQLLLFIMSNDHYVLVVEVVKNNKNQQIIGYIIGSVTQDTRNCHILSFAVNKEFRRLGLGSKLINCLQKVCKQSNLTNITLFVHVDNKSAIKFYENYGFKLKSIDKNYYKDVIVNAISYDALVLELIIK